MHVLVAAGGEKTRPRRVCLEIAAQMCRGGEGFPAFRCQPDTIEKRKRVEIGQRESQVQLMRNNGKGHVVLGVIVRHASNLAATFGLEILTFAAPQAANSHNDGNFAFHMAIESHCLP